MTRRQPRPVLIRSVSLLWYPLTLLPILALLYAAMSGYLPPLVAMVAMFLFFFWLSSLGFALYQRLRKPKDGRK
ncbi:MAG TPA: hypothetical protein VGN80_16310 [Devosiaceae bacterium]|jgi:hypothetical protein|nr:hypothetical protein [Devosiaceae bacterium]